jgi:hypothetical protein
MNDKSPDIEANPPYDLSEDQKLNREDISKLVWWRKALSAIITFLKFVAIG